MSIAARRGLAVLGSLVLHGAVVRSLTLAEAPAAAPPAPETVSFVLTSPAPEDEPASPPEPAPTAAPEPAPSSADRAPVAAAPRAVPAAPRAPTGENLESSAGGFELPSGDGTSSDAPIVAPVVSAPPAPAPPAPVASAPAPSRPAAPAPPAVVPVRQLGEKPKPPGLAGRLAGNFPPDARARGVGGAARVRVRIEPSGVATVLGVLDESDAGFGDACRRTVAGSRWSPPKDRSGRPVATLVTYQCRFRIES